MSEDGNLTLLDKARIEETRALALMHQAAGALALAQSETLWKSLVREFAQRGIDLNDTDEEEDVQAGIEDLQLALADAAERWQHTPKDGAPRLSQEAKDALTLLVRQGLISTDRAIDLAREQNAKEGTS